MDDLIRELERFRDLTSVFTLADVAIVLALSFVLSVAIGFVYRATHRGTSYSQSYAQTLVMMCMVTALIMLIIGSNIARAFSLVGALSVIRFRNAVKETRDVGYMFSAMAIGMAAGTRFYVLAAFATVVIAGVLVGMYKTNLFAKRIAERILRIRMPADIDGEQVLEPVFAKMLDDSRLVSIETVTAGTAQELVYSVVLKRGTESGPLLEAIRQVNGNNKVSLAVGQQEVDL